MGSFRGNIKPNLLDFRLYDSERGKNVQEKVHPLEFGVGPGST